MFENTLSLDIQPRFNETDGLGHINNTVIPVWFEAAREPIFEIFNPELDLNQWNLIVAGFTIAYTAPTFYGKPVTVKTWISRIGNSSFEVGQSCWQQGKKTAEAKTSLVHYDYAVEKSQPIPADIRGLLGRLLHSE
ncbi:acyl-CoA thioesterase [Shewanella sp. AS16]|uniref:acyl-CoA thioesterase n=1 Tax=Shewanella sp. AS16 TaxID=2907625 RepID=UPI001F3B7534|nr:thioesterase family protein [Shewanella sp. AS16]MCE9688134.1 acyl-CoA thioesterase [Shewanella sp. AS16]